jgi:iron complex outermembrane receptor protein
VASYRTGVFATPDGSTQTPQAPLHPEFQNPISASALWARYHQERVTFTLFHRYGKHTSNTANNPAYAIYNNDVFLGTELTTLNATLEDLSGPLGHSSSLTAHRYTLNPRSSYRNFFTRQEVGWEYAQSSTVRFDQQFTLRPGVWELVLGLSAESQNATVKTPDLQNPVDEGGPIRGTLLGTNLPADIYMLKGTGLGAFLQGMVDLHATFTLTLGARYDHDSRYGSTFNPRLGLVWAPVPRATFKLLAGSAFLAPSPQDAFNHYGSFKPDGSGGYTSAFWHLPNPGLKPQKLSTFELSGRFGLGPGLHLTATTFRTQVRDLFAQAPDAGNTNLYGGTFKGYPVDFIEVLINQGEQINRGGSLRLDYAGALPGKGRAQAHLALSYVDGTVDVRGDGRKVELPNIAPWTLRVGADVSWGSFNLSPRITRLNRQRLLDVEPGRPDRRKTLAGYTLLDLSLSYRFAALEAFLRVDNALDATYRNVSPQSNLNAIEFVGTPQNPRRVMGGVAWRF